MIDFFEVMLHLFYILFAIEMVIAIVAYTNVAEYPFMAVKQRTINYLSDRRLHIYLLLSLGVIFLFHAFRNPLTLDDIPYYVDAFYESKDASWNRVYDMGYATLKTEVGFALVIKAISSMFSFDQALFILTSAFILGAVYFSISRYSPIWWLSIFVFITDSFPQSLFILRSFVAIGLFLYAFPSILNRKLIVFLLISLAAFTMHMSAIIFLPVYFLYGVKNKLYLSVALGVIAVFTIVSFYILIPLMVEYILPEYAYYLLSAEKSEGISWKMPAFMSTLMLFRLFVMRKHFFEEGINRLLSIIMVLAATIYVAGMDFGMTSRMAMFYSNITFLIIPNTLQYIKSSSWQFACAIVYILFNSYFFFMSTSDVLWASYQLLEI